MINEVLERKSEVREEIGYKKREYGERIKVYIYFNLRKFKILKLFIIITISFFYFFNLGKNHISL